MAGWAQPAAPDTLDSDKDDDHGQEDEARRARAETQAAVRQRLGEQVADSGPERPGQDVGYPEAGDRALAEPVSQGDKADQAAEGEDAEPEPEARRLDREIARALGQREGEQDPGPAEGLAPGRDDGADRERALARVPEREDRRENGGKCGRAGAAACSCLRSANAGTGPGRRPSP